MSQVRLPASHDPVKTLKFISILDKPCEIFSRICMISFLVTSISLVLYTAFSPLTPSLRFPAPKRRAPEPETKLNLESGPTNISHILFGIGGSAETWKDRCHYNSLWWDANKTRGFVWLDEIPGDNYNDSDISVIPYRISSPGWTQFRFSSSRSAVRIARIISDSFKLNVPDVRWFVMGDDDTVYFTENLVSVLAKHDHNEMWYIGGNSESVEQDEMHSYDMAFGGGGFAISYALAEKLVNILDGCLDRYFYFYGSDQRIWACISEIGVPLTREQGFHQFDIKGNAYGLLAAHPLAPLVSLHHLDYVDSLFPYKTQADSLWTLGLAYRLDPPRILQQSFCYDYKRKWSISVAWGYSVQLYPFLLPANNLQTPLQTFKTWRTESDGPFTFNTQPLKSNPCEHPVLFMLNQAKKVGETGSLTSYERLEPRPEKMCNRTDYEEARSLQRVIVSALKLDPEYWTKDQARRRQCCELGESLRESTMHIRIRKCRPWETITTER
ncbi:hypothetical protein MANES_07G118900v8 [Manihot esculenta]|nr:hypothetical protein MANES_07G118900v8 [Manihot esculenta]